MMMQSELDEGAFDEVQVEIGYYKLFPYLKGDFVTRKDMARIMDPTNLLVTTLAGQSVATTGSMVAQTGFTVSVGSGQVQAPYKGDIPYAETMKLTAEYKVKKEAGGAAATALVEVA